MEKELYSMKSTNLIAALSMSWLAMTTTVHAADPVLNDTDVAVVVGDEWVVSTTPYFWMTFYEGTMTVNGQTVDMSGTNVFDLLSAGDLSFIPIVNYFEARKGNWGVYLDTFFVGIDFSASDISLGPGPVTASAGFDFVWALVNAGVIYTAAEWDQDGGNVAFDLMGGLRYTSYDLDLNVPVGPFEANFSNRLDWWDVTAGARLRGQFDNGWSYTLYGDVATGGSDFSVQALASVGKDFRIGRFDSTFVAGYRVLYQDWSSGNDALDLTTHGPYLGWKIKF
jgi:hypothetical protein